MSDQVKEEAHETPACCCMDIGAVIDGSDCAATIEEIFATKQDAETRLAELRAKVDGIASEAVTDRSEISETEQGFHLKASFEFANQAEALILQLHLR